MTDQIGEADQWPVLQKLRANFENKEAIYIEKGAVRVRISNIRCFFCGSRVAEADVEEIPAPGLGCGIFNSGGQDPTSPFRGKSPTRWSVGVAEGYMTFSDYEWSSRVQGAYWSIYSHPKVVKEVLELASQLSGKVDSMGRYHKINALVRGFRHSRRKVHVILTRDSVCAGDDCDAPHEKRVEVYSTLDVEAFVTEVSSGYLPSVAGAKHSWTCERNGVKIATIEQSGIRVLVRESVFLQHNRVHFTYHPAGS